MAPRTTRKFYPPRPKPHDQQQMAVSLPCKACGYDLRFTPHTCPECGKPVVETIEEIQRDRLRSAVAADVRRRVGRWRALGAFSLICTIAFGAMVWDHFYQADVSRRLRGDPDELLDIYWTEMIVTWGLGLISVGSWVFCIAVHWRSQRDSGPRRW